MAARAVAGSRLLQQRSASIFQRQQRRGGRMMEARGGEVRSTCLQGGPKSKPTLHCCFSAFFIGMQPLPLGVFRSFAVPSVVA